MVSTRRNKPDSAHLLAGKERGLSSTPDRKKKGVFSVFRKSIKYANLDDTPPTTPDEKGGTGTGTGNDTSNVSVTVIASEYDPSEPYGMYTTGMSALTDKDGGAVTRAPSRRVGFTDAPAVAVTSVENGDEGETKADADASANANANAQREGNDTACSDQSVLHQTLGFFDDICAVPKPTDGSPPRAMAAVGFDNGAPEWGTVPSEEDEESTFPSMASTVDEEYSRSLMTSTAPDSATIANNQSVEVPALAESPSLDHENFEVVLDSALLSGATPVTPSKRRSWFNNNNGDSNHHHKSKESKTKSIEPADDDIAANEKDEDRAGRKSLAKRLFSSRKSKKEEAATATAEDELLDGSTPQDRAIEIPEMAVGRPSEPLSDLAPEVTPEAEQLALAAEANEEQEGHNDEEIPTLQEATDEILSTLGSMFSTLDIMSSGSCIEDEKKDEESQIGTANMRAVAADAADTKPYEEVGPDDETDNNNDTNVTPVLPLEEEEDPKRTESQSIEVPENGQPMEDDFRYIKEDTNKDPKRTISFGGIAKKIGKSFRTRSRSASEGNFSEIKTEDSKPAAAGAPAAIAAGAPRRAKKEKPLWKTAVDPKSGKTYWYNRKTRESTYDPPPEALMSTPVLTADAAIAAAEASATAPMLNTPIRSKKDKKKKYAWKAVPDKNSGRTYYYHRKTRETTWTMPDELKQLQDEKTFQLDATPLHRNDKAPQNQPIKPKPPMLVEAAVSPESRDRISRGEQGLLGQSFDELTTSAPRGTSTLNPASDKKKEIQRLLNDMLPIEKSAVEDMVKKYEGRDDILLQKLRTKAESQPFDEPLAEEHILQAAPSRMTGRTMTHMSKASHTTKSSTITEKTERIKNTQNGRVFPVTISENQSTATSISSQHDDDLLLNPVLTPNRMRHHNYANRIPSKVPVPRERELKVEELTNSRVTAETFDKHGRVVRSRGNTSDELEDGSYYGDNEVDTYGTDSVSALSENDADISHRKGNFEQARRRALDDAIEREDWDLAAALSEGMRVSNSTGDYAEAHTSWNQSEIDKFIANNDWDAVKSYIARMREAKKDGQDVAPPPTEVPTDVVSVEGASVVRAPSRGKIGGQPSKGESHSTSKRIGSKSQLQHKQLMSDSSWTSDSYDSDDSSDTEDSE